MKLGKLEYVKDLRSVWSSEPSDFTNWLAKDENLAILSEEIGIELELIGTEVQIGDFNADIVASDSNDGSIVVIENQLEQTDHTHLGQIITYASGLDAKIIVWIVKNVREEHRQAIDWLNEHTDTEINIFLCRIELWKIDNSPCAPKFQIISSPNNWSKTMRNTVDNSKLTETQKLRIEYWERLSEEINQNYPKFNARTPTKLTYYTLTIGKPSAKIKLDFSRNKSLIKARVFVTDDELLDYLYDQKKEIESELGFNLEWDIDSNTKGSSIYITQKCNVSNKNNWDKSIIWHLEMASKLYDAFSDRVKQFY